MPKSISIIIPTYNRANYLKKLINQLLTQSQPPYEIIVVDDHSTDNTAVLVKTMSASSSHIKYIANQGHHQRDAKKTGLKFATCEYFGFFDDDAEIPDPHFLAKLQPHLCPHHIIQAKVILEQMGRKNRPDISWKDILATRPFPILELITSNFNCGTKRRPIFPLIEWGNFWHRSLKDYFIDDNLIKDAYGESYSASLKLYRAGIKLLIEPSLVIRHLGAPSGGSHKFNKKTMLVDFTEFHYGYFYNMIYLHKRFFPYWIWLWLPFYFTKSLIALTINWNIKGWYEYAYKPIKISLTNKSRGDFNLFIWQGNWQGGAEHITFGAANYLHSRGINVTLGVYHINKNLSLRQIEFSVPSLVPISFRPLYASLIWRAKHAKQYQAVYAHTLGWWKTKSNYLFINDGADLDAYQAYLKHSYKKIVAVIWRWLYLNLCLKKATILFAASQSFSNYLHRKDIPSDRIKKTSSFYNDEVFFYTHRPPPRQPYRILFIGNYLDKRKNFAILYNTLLNKEWAQVHIVGGPKKDSTQNFTYHGYLSQPDTARQLKQSDIFILPSQGEGFSIALLVALGTGIPCLVNKAAINPEIIGIDNLIPYESDNEISPKLQEIIQHYHRYNKFDKRITRFTQSTVLGKDYEVIKKYVS